ELRGPLNALVGWVYLLKTGKLDEATQAQALAAIDRTVKTQTRQIEDLLDVTRIMSGKLHVSMQPVRLRDILTSAVETAQTMAAAKGIQLRATPGATAEVLGDPDRLYQVVWNLLSNAIKFTPAGGRVEARLRHDRDAVRLEVADTGIGMSADFLPHVFERFRQADTGPARV